MIFTQEFSDYLDSLEKTILIDVRSEGEFAQGHIPSATNIPLLNNEERAIVGTIYKKKGNREAVQKGFELVGGKFSDYISRVKELSKANTISVYCWRGGMRSNIMAWLFSTAGYQVNLLKGGYKSFRSHSIASLESERNYRILGGKTGSGKTEMILHLKRAGEQVIDLEAIANHRGSAFGGIGKPSQPSNEQFENELYWQLRSFAVSKQIWLENESRLIGKNKIPDAIYAQMRKADVLEMIVPTELRIKRIITEYGAFPTDILVETTRKVEKKLGNLRMKQAIEALNNKELELWAKLMLDYYDNFYEYGLSQRIPDSISYVEIEDADYALQVDRILHTIKN